MTAPGRDTGAFAPYSVNTAKERKWRKGHLERINATTSSEIGAFWHQCYGTWGLPPTPATCGIVKIQSDLSFVLLVAYFNPKPIIVG